MISVFIFDGILKYISISMCRNGSGQQTKLLQSITVLVLPKIVIVK